MPRKPKPPPADAMTIAYGVGGFDPAVSAACLDEAGAVHHASARSRFADVEPGVSVREGMDRLNWEFFRPGEHVPRRHRDVMRTVDRVYRYNGVVKFVIDMMTHFVTQGVRVYHPAASKEDFYKSWWKKVRGHAVSERFVNHLYRYGTACPKRTFGPVPDSAMRDFDRVAVAGLFDDAEVGRVAVPKGNRIPLKYNFLYPGSLVAIDPDLGLFAGNPRYGVRVSESVLRAIKSPSLSQQSYVSELPDYVLEAVSGGAEVIPLDPEKASVWSYMKDDWQPWADPLILSVLKDLILYEKMKDADRAALDGSIRNIRVWTIGLPEHGLQPGPAAFRKLRDQLLANAGGGSMDLIWDPTLSLKETSTDVAKFLGAAKYEPVLQAIYAGLGIPQNLVGGKQGSMTGDALNLKTLIERLQHARDLLVEYWDREFYLLQKVRGDRKPAGLKFELMSLSDEAAEKMLLFHLYDRNAMSLRSLQEKFGLVPDVEERLTRREYRRYDEGDLPHKTGPYTEPQPHPGQLAAAAMQQGTLAPTEAGVKKKPRAKGDRGLLDRQEAMQQQTIDLQKEQDARDAGLAERQQKLDEKQGQDLHRQKLSQNEDLHRQRLDQKGREHEVLLPVKKKAAERKVAQKGAPGQGRPTGVRDSKPRDARTPKPRTSASPLVMQARAREAYRVVSDAVTAAYLGRSGKSNLRKLTAAEAAELELLRFDALCSVAEGERLTGERLASLGASPPAPSPGGRALLDRLAHEAYGSRGVTPTADDVRELHVYAYAVLAGVEGPGGFDA